MNSKYENKKKQGNTLANNSREHESSGELMSQIAFLGTTSTNIFIFGRTTPNITAAHAVRGLRLLKSYAKYITMRKTFSEAEKWVQLLRLFIAFVKM